VIARYFGPETVSLGEELQPWVDALSAIDRKKGDGKLLISLLVSAIPIPPQARLYIADLLDRKKLRLVAKHSLPETHNVDVELLPWLEALLAIEEGDKSRLSRLLTSEAPIPPLARRYLADLEIRNAANRQKTPLYKFSDRVSKLRRAVAAARYLRKHEREKTREGAFEMVAKLYNLTADAVRKAYDGDDEDVRTMVKKRPHLKGAFDR
jgi:hypothetical protein